VSAPAAYPAELEQPVVLRDGRRVHLRPVRPDDAPALCALYDRLSVRTAYQRFFTVMRRLPPDWARVFATVDYRRRLALVAEAVVDGEPALVGVGRYEAGQTDPTPEVAFVVQDGWQGQGLGTVLLQSLIRAGAARGYRRFRAYVLAENAPMLGLLARFTAVRESRLEDGVRVIEFEPR